MLQNRTFVKSKVLEVAWLDFAKNQYFVGTTPIRKHVYTRFRTFFTGNATLNHAFIRDLLPRCDVDGTITH